MIGVLRQTKLIMKQSETPLWIFSICLFLQHLSSLIQCINVEVEAKLLYYKFRKCQCLEPVLILKVHTLAYAKLRLHARRLMFLNPDHITIYILSIKKNNE